MGEGVDVVAPLATVNDSVAHELMTMDNADRENWQKPQIVISRLGDLSDKVVADIGAGTGYFTMPLARKAQKVIAVEIEQQYLDYINRRLSRTPDKEGLNVETRLTAPNDPALKAGEADLVLVVNTYAFIESRVDYFQRVHKGTAAGGKVVVVDFKKEPLPVGPPMEEKVEPGLVIGELEAAGFEHVGTDVTSLDYQYIVTVVKR